MMGTIRFFSIFLLFGLLLTANPTYAAHNKPNISVIGFSPDGRFFAFEQSGTNEATGIAYADLYVIDSKDDSWVPGTPIKIRSHTDQGGEAHAKKVLHHQARRMMRRLGLDRASVGVAFRPKDTNQIILTLPWKERDYIHLHARSDLKAESCPIPEKKRRSTVQGFYITLQRPTEIAVLHNDTKVPRNRGCALSYAFHSTYIKPRGNDAVLATLISYDEQVSETEIAPRYMVITKIIKAPGNS